MRNGNSQSCTGKTLFSLVSNCFNDEFLSDVTNSVLVMGCTADVIVEEGTSGM